MGRIRQTITRKTRREVYYRDGMQCVYCGGECVPFATVGTPMAATLEHRTCHSRGGEDSHDNLVVACVHCNSSRRDTSMRTWLAQLEAEHGEDYVDRIRRELRNRARRVIREDEAREWARSIREDEADDTDTDTYQEAA